ncbi:MAG: hypothetical protein OZSIB_0816 [Candidatus Ozemobacter sibiricus]|uniref:Uncharacterized protein n=1 Tax=Candidatus Ozemobacter sibiricus TaxID=2268124 RepID=A0A367ZWF1_9BACT|nr:MAG: hypothetical protein OZSIB_0816 [Candidatus Ozemobacter sibiricus]
MEQTDKTARMVADLQRSVVRWLCALLLAAIGLGAMLRRRLCWGIFPGVLLGAASFQLLVSTVLRLRGASGAIFAAAAVISLLKFGFLVAAIVGLWYAGVDLFEMLGGLFVSQLAIAGACTGVAAPLASSSAASSGSSSPSSSGSAASSASPSLPPDARS